VGYRRPPNLRDMLMRAEVRSKKEITAQKLREKTERNQKMNINNIQFPDNKSTNTSKLIQPRIPDFFNRKPTQTITDSSSTSEVGNTDTTLINSNSTVTKTTSSCHKFYLKAGNKNACYNPICKYCPYIDRSEKISSNVTGESFPAKCNITCNSSNLIYCIYCNQCGMQYVGETLRNISERLREHLLNIKHCKSIQLGRQDLVPPSFIPHTVGLHFAQVNHRGKSNLKIKVLDFINIYPSSKKAKYVRTKVEKNWIHMLRTPAPQGLNMMD
jgi:hypothetical protein